MLKRSLRILGRYTAANKGKLFLAGLLVLVSGSIYAMRLRRLLEYVPGYYSIADAFKNGMDTELSGFVVTPVLLYLLHSMIRYDFLPAFLMSRKDKRELFGQQLAAGLFLSLLMTAVMYLSVRLTGGILGLSGFNWDSRSSLYYLLTGTVRESLGIWQVEGAFVLTWCVRNFLVCMASLCLHWRFESAYWDYILFLSVTAVEICFPDIHIFYRALDITYTRWGNPGQWALMAAYAVILAAAVSFLAGWIIRKKEFYKNSRESIL